MATGPMWAVTMVEASYVPVDSVCGRYDWNDGIDGVNPGDPCCPGLDSQ